MILVPQAGELTALAPGLAVILAGLGLTLAWLPAVRTEGWTALLPRLLVVAGLAAILGDRLVGLGGVLGLGLVALGALAGWQARPAPSTPRPRRTGIVVAAAVTGLLLVAGDRGWWLLDRVPAAAQPWTVLLLGGVGILATVAIADRERVRLRDRLAREIPPS
jgi:hypothetical protein